MLPTAHGSSDWSAATARVGTSLAFIGTCQTQGCSQFTYVGLIWCCISSEWTVEVCLRSPYRLLPDSACEEFNDVVSAVLQLMGAQLQPHKEGQQRDTGGLALVQQGMRLWHPTPSCSQALEKPSRPKPSKTRLSISGATWRTDCLHTR